MSKHLRIWLFVLLGTLLTSTSLLAQGVITMTTSKAVGKTIKLRIEANGNVTIEWAQEVSGGADSAGRKSYRLKSQTITIRGDVTELNCSWNQLTSLDVSKNIALTELYCSNNQLTSLNVSRCARLNTLYCDSNRINGKAMNKLENSLPNRRRKSSGAILLVDNSPEKRDKNRCSPADVTISEKKNWSVL